MRMNCFKLINRCYLFKVSFYLYVSHVILVDWFLFCTFSKISWISSLSVPINSTGECLDFWNPPSDTSANPKKSAFWQCQWPSAVKLSVYCDVSWVFVSWHTYSHVLRESDPTRTRNRLASAKHRMCLSPGASWSRKGMSRQPHEEKQFWNHIPDVCFDVCLWWPRTRLRSLVSRTSPVVSFPPVKAVPVLVNLKL